MLHRPSKASLVSKNPIRYHIQRNENPSRSVEESRCPKPVSAPPPTASPGRPGQGGGEAVLPRPSSLADNVYDVLLGQLMSLQIQPGERLTMDNLSRELGVSQTPLREALGRLEANGLVLKTHLVGYRAAPQLSREQFEELFEFRLLLEPAAAARAAELLDDKKSEHLQGIARSMSAPAPGNRYRDFAAGDAAVPRLHRRDQRQHADPGFARPAAHPHPHLPALFARQGHPAGDRRAPQDRRGNLCARCGQGRQGDAHPYREVAQAGDVGLLLNVSSKCGSPAKPRRGRLISSTRAHREYLILYDLGRRSLPPASRLFPRGSAAAPPCPFRTASTLMARGTPHVMAAPSTSPIRPMARSSPPSAGHEGMLEFPETQYIAVSW